MGLRLEGVIIVIHGYSDQSASHYRIAAIVRAFLDAGDERRFQHFGERLIARLARDPLRG